MADKSRKMLEEQILSDFDNLKSLTQGTDEYSAALDELIKLYKLKIEENKNIMDRDEKLSRREMELEQSNRDADLKERQIDNEIRLKEMQIDNDVMAHDRDEQLKRDQIVEQVKDRYFKYGAEVGVAVLTLIFYTRYMNKGFKFEETGTVASHTFRNLISNFKFGLKR